MKGLKSLWQNYKYRFVPWLSFSLSKNSLPTRRIVSPSNQQQSQCKISPSISVSSEVVRDSIRDYLKFLAQQASTAGNETVQDAFYRRYGFQLRVGPSSVAPSGLGVSLHRGHIAAHQLVALYPGLVYQPGEPLLLPSLGNSFIFRCADGVHIDGKRSGLSRLLYRSCAQRERSIWRNAPGADDSWFVDPPGEVRNLLAIGQFVNNCTGQCPANVAYFECHFSWEDILSEAMKNRGTPLAEMWRFLPNTHYSTHSMELAPSLKCVALITLQPIEAGQELLSNYFTLIFQKI